MREDGKIDYVELPGTDLPATKSFYGQAFGWTFTDYGPTYAAFGDSGLDGGFQADPAEVPIAPLNNPLNFASLLRGRRDHHGRHIENFDKTVWKNEFVQATLQDLTATMKFWGNIKYIPFWCLDRLLGLMVQAKFFEQGQIIGHKLPLPECLRSEDNPPNHQRTNRYYVFAEVLLLKRFPNKGYFWNLVLSQIKDMPQTYLRDRPLIISLRKRLKSQ